jgi:hypothetical protein
LVHGREFAASRSYLPEQRQAPEIMMAVGVAIRNARRTAMASPFVAGAGPTVLVVLAVSVLIPLREDRLM